MKTSRVVQVVLQLTALVVALGAGRLAAAPNEAFLGRWALTLPNGAAGWLEVKKEKGYFDGSILWGGGSVLPVSSVVISEDTLFVTRTTDVQRKDANGKVVRTQQFTEAITAKLGEGDTLNLTRLAPRGNSSGYDSAQFTGKRIPALPPRPDLKKVKFGEPVVLFNGKDLAGWKAKEDKVESAWKVEGGVLSNIVPKHEPGTPAKHGQSPHGKRIRGLQADARGQRARRQQQRRLFARHLRDPGVRLLRQAARFTQHGRALQPHHAERRGGETGRRVADARHDAGRPSRDGRPERQNDHRQPTDPRLHRRRDVVG